MPAPRRRPAALAALAASAALTLSLAACATPGPAAHPPAVGAPAPSALAPPLPRQPQALVLRHATVLPASGPAILDGAVVLEGGRITAVGPSALVATPPGARELDLTGRFVSPGLIDSHTHLGVYGQPASFASADGNEMTSPITAEAQAEHAFWPQDAGLGRALAGGVTAALVLPGSANLVGGRGLAVKLRPGRSAAEARFPGAPASIKMACGENPRRVYGEGRKAAPQTRMGNASVFRQAFLDAQAYQAGQAEWEAKAAKGGSPGPRPRRDLKLETLAAVLRGEVLVQIHCYRADELVTMLAVADELGFTVRAFHHALEAYKVRDLLAARGVAVATHADWWGYKLEAWDGIPENAGLVTRAGGRATIQSDSPVVGQWLGQEAAKAMWAARAAGVPVTDEEALRWITLDAAWVMGVERQAGSLEPGKMADVVVWSGHPFSVYSRAEQVYVDGLLTYDARAGISPSDFELREPLGAPPWAQPLAGRPQGAPSPAAPCDGAATPCPAALPVTADRCVAITGAQVVGGAGPAAVATVVLEGGKITQVAPGLDAPAGCRPVDGRGLVLSPGLLDAYSSLGIEEVSSEEGAHDLGPEDRPGAAGADPVQAALRAADSVNPASSLLPVARLGGLTGAVAAPSGGLVSGQGAFLTTDGQVRVGSVALFATLGGPGGQALHSTRGAALQRLRELLDDARTYAARRADFDQGRLRRVSASRLDLEALQPVLAGQLPLVVEADRAADLRGALALAREWKLKLVILGATEGWQLAGELASARVPVLVDPQRSLPASFDQLGARPDNAAILAAAGVPVLIAPRDMAGAPHHARTLRQVAGLAVAHGLPWDAALAGVTCRVAEAYGLPGGKVAAGGPADLVLWSGDPLELSSRPLAVWIGGRQAPLGSRQQALLERYRVLGAEAPGATEPATRR